MHVILRKLQRVAVPSSQGQGKEADSKSTHISEHGSIVETFVDLRSGRYHCGYQGEQD